MYRDDPLDDEEELRAIVGDDAVDTLAESTLRRDGASPLEAALDVLRVLQGWVEDDEAGRWFLKPQRRLDQASPIAALASGAYEEVGDAARAWTAAHG